MKDLFNALVRAFYDPIIYRTAMMRWQGFGGRYIVALGFVIAIMLSITTVFAVHEFERTTLPQLIAQVPDITIDKGIINVEGAQPVHIKTGDDKFDVLIDTSKTEKELRDTKTPFGVGKNFVFFQSANKYQVIYTDKLGNNIYKINKQLLHTGWQENALFLKFLLLPLFWVSELIDLVVQCVIVALFSYVVTAFIVEEYDFLTRMRLSALALTPAALITTTLSISIGHQTAPWFSVLLACLYIYVMILLMRKLSAK